MSHRDCILSFTGGSEPRLLMGLREECPRVRGRHRAPVAAAGEVLARLSGLIQSPYGEGPGALELRLVSPPEGAELAAPRAVLADPAVLLHPAERFALRTFALRGESLLRRASTPALWRPFEGVAAHQVGPELWVIPLRSPTLPPARHTNMLVLGGPGLVVDPGAQRKDERQRALGYLRQIEASGTPLQAIWLTHHHLDHHSAAATLARALGLPVWGHLRTAELLRGGLALDRAFADGEEIPTRAGAPSGWEALHTPGHAPGHLCLWHPATRRLVAGDMVAGVGTVLIDPEDGDMGQYLASLERLEALGPEQLYPAHGPTLCGGVDALRFYRAHRLEREAKILAALGTEPRPFEAILRASYDDVPAAVLPLAARSLESHLRKLEREGRLIRDAAAGIELLR